MIGYRSKIQRPRQLHGTQGFTLRCPGLDTDAGAPGELVGLMDAAAYTSFAE